MPAGESRTERSRRLRRDQTPAEAKLWRALKGGQLEGFKFRRQVAFDRYFADFVCLEAKLIVELDGGQHSEAEVYDSRRTEALERAGFLVLRFWNQAVRTEFDGVLDEILAALRSGRS